MLWNCLTIAFFLELLENHLFELRVRCEVVLLLEHLKELVGEGRLLLVLDLEVVPVETLEHAIKHLGKQCELLPALDEVDE